MAGTLVVDKVLVDRTVSDTVRFGLTRAPMIVFWVIVLLAVLGLLVLLIADPAQALEMWWFALALLVMVTGLVLLVVLPVRRAVRFGLPPGSEVSASVSGGILRMEAAQGKSEIRVDALRRTRLAGGTVILQLVGAGTASVLPRELLDDDEAASLGIL